MPCRSQDFVSRNVPQRVDGGERPPRGVRRNKLVPLLGFPDYDTVNLIINENLFEKTLSDVV
jgi:hypothetical protein